MRMNEIKREEKRHEKSFLFTISPLFFLLCSRLFFLAWLKPNYKMHKIYFLFYILQNQTREGDKGPLHDPQKITDRQRT